MSFMNLWGYIALISLLILLLIYILKPNYQQQFISSTHIWKLSLKYKKKKVPISKLKNILLIICQVAILTLLTVVILKPVKITKTIVEDESIIIVDASASMRTEYEDESRFTRAIDKVREKAESLFDGGGTVSIVMATDSPYYLVERATDSRRYEVDKTLSDMENETDSYCTYSTCDLNESITFCQDILEDNPNTKIYVYTDQEVDYADESITVYTDQVRKKGEYNVAILNAYAEMIDNSYSYTVELASYGADINVDLDIQVNSANITDENPSGTDYPFSEPVDLSSDETMRVVFINDDVDYQDEDDNTLVYRIQKDFKIYTYESVDIKITSSGEEIEDGFTEDNTFEIYGGTKETIKILYATSLPNSFVNVALLTMKSTFQERYNFEITEYKSGDEVPSEGYDIYFYEHEMMPSQAPTDGVVIYLDPLADTAGSGFRVQGYRDLSKISLSLTEDDTSELTKNMTADNITVSRYNVLAQYDASYKVLMSVDNNPMIMMQDDGATKSVAVLFSLHYSNLPLLMEWPVFIYNIFNYFLPATVEENSYEVGETITINSRGSEVDVEGYGETEKITEFPGTITETLPGTYELRQTTYFGKDIDEFIYIRMPESESNIFSTTETLSNPVPVQSTEDLVTDLLFWFAVALTGFCFVEWLLKGNDAV